MNVDWWLKSFSLKQTAQYRLKGAYFVLLCILKVWVGLHAQATDVLFP